MKEMIKLFRPFVKGMLLIALLNAVSTLCSLFMPYLMSGIVNEGIAEKNLDVIYRLGAGMFLLAAVGLLTALLNTHVNANVSSGFTYALQNKMLQKINSLTFEEYSSVGTSSLLTRCTDDVMTLQEVAASLAYAVVSIPIMVIGSIVMTLSQDWSIALLMLIVVPLSLGFVSWLAKKMDKLWDIADKRMDDQNRMMRERLSGLRVIRAFDREAFEHGRVAGATAEMTGICEA